MTKEEWKYFSEFRDNYKIYCKNLEKYSEELKTLQKEAALKDSVPEYSFENAVVYSRAYDEVTSEDNIRLLVIGDNPGKDEQLNKNCKYLVGQSGKIAEGFFKKNPELEIDFRKNVLILNKTPVHTAKTKELKYLSKNGSKEIAEIIKESQLWMAEQTAFLHQNLKDCKLWIIGYSELKEKQIFSEYREQFKSMYFKSDITNESWEKVFVYQHFSMNRFLVDLKTNFNQTLGLERSLDLLGYKHRIEIFGI